MIWKLIDKKNVLRGVCYGVLPALLGVSAGAIAADEPASLDDLFQTDSTDGPLSGEAQQGSDDAPPLEESLFGISEEKKSKVWGFYQLEYAYTYPSPSHTSKIRNLLELGSDGRINESASWTLSARGAFDAVFALTDFYSERVRDDREWNGMLYQTYVDVSRGDFDFRLGRQNIIWGEMVGLFFADVVSAKDLRQFIAQDFDLIRLPQWAARAEHFKGDFHSEAIWIPYMTYDEIGAPGDDFYPLGTDPLPGNPIIKDDNRPANTFSNSAYGLRLSMLKAGWDVSGFFYHSVDAMPYFLRTFENGRNVITPEHDKIDQLGATLAKDFGAVLLKGEAIYTRDRWFSVDDAANPNGVVRQNTFDYIIGLEHTALGGTLLNFQFFQRWYTNHDSDILFDEVESGVSLYARKEFSSRTEGELLLISGLNRTDWMFRPRITWDLSNHWGLAVGADIFGGDRIGLFGRFDDSDRVYTNLRYTF